MSADGDLLTLLRATPGVAAVYPARSVGRRLLAALDPESLVIGAAGHLDEGDGGARIEVSVGLDGTVPAPAVGRAVAAAVAAGMPGVRPREVTVRIVSFD